MPDSTRLKMSAKRKGIKKSLVQRWRMIEGWKKRRAKMQGISVDLVPQTSTEIEVRNLLGRSAERAHDTPSEATHESETKEASRKPCMKKTNVREWVKKHGKIQLF